MNPPALVQISHSAHLVRYSPSDTLPHALTCLASSFLRRCRGLLTWALKCTSHLGPRQRERNGKVSWSTDGRPFVTLVFDHRTNHSPPSLLQSAPCHATPCHAMPCYAMLLRSFSLLPLEKKRVRRDCPRASGRGPARVRLVCLSAILFGVLVGTMMPEEMARSSLPVRPLDRSRSQLLAFWGQQPLQSRLESGS